MDFKKLIFDILKGLYLQTQRKTDRGTYRARHTSGNLGFSELYRFRLKASAEEKAKMDELVKKNDIDGFHALIKKVLGIDLVITKRAANGSLA